MRDGVCRFEGLMDHKSLLYKIFVMNDVLLSDSSISHIL